jgi:hypothetical protein
MAYIHCHKCGWQQDDFYSRDGYNPAKYLKSWDDVLFGGKLEEQFTTDIMFVRENGKLTKREVLAREYERFANKIRGMHWITWEDYKKDPNKKCPICGNGLDID